MKNQNHIKIFSFDVFDTCISRIFENPTDLFFQVGMKIAPEEFTEKNKEKFANDFMIQRISAERRASNFHGKKRSCRLPEIYSLIDLPHDCRISKNEIMEIEKQTELSSSYPIYSTKILVDELRKKNARIIFISDMYLDSEFIKTLLAKHDFYKDGDRVYSSSQSTLTKRSGKLFEKVVINEKIHPTEMIHHGDNYLTDIKPAKRLGINTCHIDTRILPHEIKFKNQPYPEACRINAIPKYIRLSQSNTFTSEESHFFSDVAPAMIAFTIWCLSKARSQGIKRLYFLARDGEVPFKIAKILNSQFPDLELTYLYGSRKAWLLPSIDLQDSTWKNLAVPPFRKSSLFDCLERLSLTKDEIFKLSLDLKITDHELFCKESAAVCSKKLDFILADNRFKSELQHKIEVHRDACIDYLSQAGLFEEKKWGVVDTGWSLNNQAALKRIVNFKNPKISICGFYFGLSMHRLEEKVAGKSYSFVEDKKFFYSHSATIETCLFPTTSSATIGYEKVDGSITPVFSQEKKTKEEIIFSEKLHSYINEYALFVRDSINPNWFYQNVPIFERHLKRILSNPAPSTIKLVAALGVIIDPRQENSQKTPHIEKIDIVKLLSIVKSFFTKKNPPQIFWPEASAELSTPAIKYILKILIKLKEWLKK